MPEPELVAHWTGFYAGVNAGGVFGGDNTTTTFGGLTWVNPDLAAVGGLPWATSVALASNSVTSVANSGFIGGGQIGYDWQLRSSFVIGVEADIQGLAGASGSSSVIAVTPVVTPLAVDNYISGTSVSRSLDYLGTVRGRIGYLVTPTLLAYATGGLAYGGANLSSSFLAQTPLLSAIGVTPVVGASSYSDTRVGWTVGGGLEWLFAPNWSAKLEYLYYDLGTAATPKSAFNQSFGLAGLLGVGLQQTAAQFNGHIVRAGLNYHFNWGATDPIVVK